MNLIIPYRENTNLALRACGYKLSVTFLPKYLGGFFLNGSTFLYSLVGYKLGLWNSLTGVSRPQRLSWGFSEKGACELLCTGPAINVSRYQIFYIQKYNVNICILFSPEFQFSVDFDMVHT